MASEIEKTVSRLIRPEIREQRVYPVPDAEGFIKLDAMENPYSLPDDIRQGLIAAFRDVALNRYPDGSAHKLKERLYRELDVPKEMDILLGNGSDELIQILLLALARPGCKVVAPTPTFVMYQVIASAVGATFIGVPLRQDFSLDMPALLAAVEAHQPGVIFLAYPNNPTGNLFAEADIKTLLEKTSGLVVVDEAYHVFAQTTFMGRLPKFENLLVMRTLSKQGLAGLRLGMLIGRKQWLSEFDKLRLPYNISTLSQVGAEFILSQPAFLQEQGKQLRQQREQLYQGLNAIPGIHAWPSEANFILFRVQNKSATVVYEAIKRAGVLIKNLDGTDATLVGCLRVTVGTVEENAAFLTAVKQTL